MATTTAKPRRSRGRATGATEPAATEHATTETTATEAAPETNGTPAAPNGSDPATGAAATGPDPYVMIVAGQLAGKPDGITGPDLVKLAGLAPGKTAQILTAMQLSGAANRVPTEDPDGDDKWILGEADVSTVDPASVPTHCVCRECGNTHRRQITVTVSGRRGGTPGTNGDGNPRFGKGELEKIVRDFVRENPGHHFSDTDIARELSQRLNRKVHNGAVYVATKNLVAKGELALANPSG